MGDYVRREQYFFGFFLAAEELRRECTGITSCIDKVIRSLTAACRNRTFSARIANCRKVF